MDKTISLKNIVFFILILGIVALAIFSLDILMILFASFVITCAINPIIDKLELKMPRIFATTLILLILILLSCLIILPIVSISIDQAQNLANNFNPTLKNIENILHFKIFNKSLSSFITLESLKEPIAQGAKSIVENSILAGKFIANALTTFFAMAIIIFYLAYDKSRIFNKFIEFFPNEKKEHARKILNNISQKVGNYIFAQAIAMIFVGALTTIGLLIIHNDHAFILGLITCLLDIIPVIGPTIAVAIGLLTSIDSGLGIVLLTFAIYMIAQWAQNQLLKPIVFGKMLDMHPLLIIVALLISARFLGVWGVILSPAIASVVCVLVDELYLNKINKKEN